MPYMFGVCSVSETEQEVLTDTRDTNTFSSGATTEVLLILPHRESLLPTVALTLAAKSSCVASN